jgi:hypothetical protein
MVPSGVFVEKPAPGRIRLRPHSARHSLSDLTSLETKSDRPEVQEFLREAIRQGRIRVQPLPGSPTQVKIVRVAPGERPVAVDHRL